MSYFSYNFRIMFKVVFFQTLFSFVACTCTILYATNEWKSFKSHQYYGISDYDTNMDVCWVIEANKKHVIKVTTGDMDVHSGTDEVVVRKRGTNTSEILGRFPRDGRTFTFVNRHEQMFISFKSDESETGRRCTTESVYVECEAVEADTRFVAGSFVLTFLAIFIIMVVRWLILRRKDAAELKQKRKYKSVDSEYTDVKKLNNNNSDEVSSFAKMNGGFSETEYSWINQESSKVRESHESQPSILSTYI